MKIEALKQEAAKARSVFDSNYGLLKKTEFELFPRGACGPSSHFLGEWLSKCYDLSIEVVLGIRGKDDESHAWLECQSYVIDITSDQFSDGCGSSYVGKAGIFHCSFSVVSKYEPSVPFGLDEDYKLFTSCMRKA